MSNLTNHIVVNQLAYVGPSCIFRLEFGSEMEGRQDGPEHFDVHLKNMLLSKVSGKSTLALMGRHLQKEQLGRVKSKSTLVGMGQAK